MSKSEKMTISMIGNSAEAVTGSSVLINMPKAEKQILLECGLIQENETVLQQYRRNNANFSYKPQNISYAFLLHQHIDHCGLFPLFYKRKADCNLIVPEGSFKLLKLMWEDSAVIMERDAMSLSKKFGKHFEPIYTKEDVEYALTRVVEFPIGEKIKLDNDVEFMFLHSGHIVRACQLVLWLSNGSQTRKVAYTSDLGSISIEPRLFVEELEPIPSANVLISECTYSDKTRTITQKDREKDLEKIKSITYDVMEENGTLLFPAFSLQRSQNFIKILYDLFYYDEHFHYPIYIASPLTKKISDIWNELLESEEDKELWNKIKGWSHIRFIDNFDVLESIVNDWQPKIIIAASGMMSQGYSPWIASKILPKANCGICLIGYAGEGTLSWKLKQKKQKSVKINDKQIKCRCRVISLNSFSSHIQYEDLMLYLTGGLSDKSGCSQSYDTIVLHHGEMKSKVEFAKELKNRLEKKNKTTKVVCANKSTIIKV